MTTATQTQERTQNKLCFVLFCFVTSIWGSASLDNFQFLLHSMNFLMRDFYKLIVANAVKPNSRVHYTSLCYENALHSPSSYWHRCVIFFQTFSSRCIFHQQRLPCKFGILVLWGWLHWPCASFYAFKFHAERGTLQTNEKNTYRNNTKKKAGNLGETAFSLEKDMLFWMKTSCFGLNSIGWSCFFVFNKL